MDTGSMLIYLVGVLGLSLTDSAEWKDVKGLMSGIAASRATLDNLPIHAALGLHGNYDGIEVRDQANTARQSKLLRIQQMFLGLPVYGAKVTIEIDDTTRAYSNLGSGRLVANIHRNVRSAKPAISKQAALQIAKDSSGFDPETSKTRSEKVELMIKLVGDVAKLVYRVLFFVSGKDRLGRNECFVDANTGDVSEQWIRLETNNYQLSGIGGNKRIGNYTYDGNERPFLGVQADGDVCVMANEYVRVFNLDGDDFPKDSQNPYTFNCSGQPSDEINGGYSSVNDVMYYATLTFEMYTVWANITPTQDKPVDVWVHYDKNYVNAYYDGRRFVFGDGNGIQFYPLVVADIVAHEFTHAFIHENSDLIYSEQSGGVNEAFSDLGGEAMEEYLTRADMFAGQDAAVAPGTGFRNLCNQAHPSITHVRDFKKEMNVHSSSGVFNKAACIMKGHQEWSIRKVFAVFAHANRFFWDNNSNFTNAACGVAQSAFAMGFDNATVIDAFNQVGIPICQF